MGQAHDVGGGACERRFGLGLCFLKERTDAGRDGKPSGASGARLDRGADAAQGGGPGTKAEQLQRRARPNYCAWRQKGFASSQFHRGLGCRALNGVRNTSCSRPSRCTAATRPRWSSSTLVLVFGTDLAGFERAGTSLSMHAIHQLADVHTQDILLVQPRLSAVM